MSDNTVGESADARSSIERFIVVDHHRRSVESIAGLRVFNRRMSAMTHSGVSLVRQFAALIDLPDPFASVSSGLRADLEDGQTLSAGLTKHPNLFPALYVAMVRAGEIGGVLDVCFERLGKFLQLDWRIAAASAMGSEGSIVFRTDSDREFCELTRPEQTATLILLCEMLSMLLMSGVPILTSLGLLSPAMPGIAGKATVAAAIERVRAGERLSDGLRSAGLFPLFVLALIDSGEVAATLDITLHQAALALAEELEMQIGKPIDL